MIKVGLYQSNYRTLDSGWTCLPPLAFAYIAAYAREHMGADVDFVVERDIDALIAHKPDIVGITYVTHSARHAGRMARQVRDELGCPVLGGGPHVSTLPTALEEGFDIGIVGEGEATFLELLQLYKAEGRFEPNSLAKINGINYRDAEGVLRLTPRRIAIPNLDTIPPPDRHIFRNLWNDPQQEWQMMTTRGCPYDCSFCSVIVQWGQKYRCFSEQYVIDEMMGIRENFPATRSIHFFDDLFTVKRERVLRILAMMRERGLHEGMEFSCFVRSNLIDEALMEAFALTNFTILNVGFESGSDDVLKLMNKQAADIAKSNECIELARRYGIRFSSCFILGSRGEKREDIIKTVDFVRENMDVFHQVSFVPLMVFPGTPVFEQARDVGVDEDHLDGITLDIDDFANDTSFLKERWPYINEANIPREEMLAYVQLGDLIGQMAMKSSGSMRHVQKVMNTPEHIASNVPIVDIIRAKARRRMTRFMPGY